MNILDKAIMVADILHCKQKYDDGDYIEHLKLTAKTLLDHYPTASEDLLAAAYLHDSIEDTQMKYSLIKKYFNENVADIVYRVTDELGTNRKERILATYPKIRGHMDATLIKLADRLANVNAAIGYDNRGFIKMYQQEFNTMYTMIWAPYKVEDQNQDKIKAINSLWDSLRKALKIEEV